VGDSAFPAVTAGSQSADLVAFWLRYPSRPPIDSSSTLPVERDTPCTAVYIDAELTTWLVGLSREEGCSVVPRRAPQCLPVEDVVRVEPQPSFVIDVCDLDGPTLPKGFVEGGKPFVGVAAELDHLAAPQVN